MPRSQPNATLQKRVELAIALIAPALDLMLAAGSRLSSVLGRGEEARLPARVTREGEHAARGLPPRRSRQSGRAPRL